LGIRNWNDLNKIILIKGRRPKEFPNRSWFEISGRQLSYNPNKCHPKAIYVSGFALQFCQWQKRWLAHIDYSYLHGSGGWEITLKQNHREHLDSFAIRIKNWLNEVLVPEDGNAAMIRQEEVRNWRIARDAFKEIFYDSDLKSTENDIADLLIKIKGSSLTECRIPLTKRRITSLKRWIKDTLNKQK